MHWEAINKNVIGYRLQIAITRMESVGGKRCRDQPTVVRLPDKWKGIFYILYIIVNDILVLDYNPGYIMFIK